MLNSPSAKTVPSGPLISETEANRFITTINVYSVITKRKFKRGRLRASMVVKEEDEERSGKDAPGGGSVRRSLSSFCNRRLSLAA